MRAVAAGIAGEAWMLKRLTLGRLLRETAKS
jgi:hypothetical protein